MKQMRALVRRNVGSLEGIVALALISVGVGMIYLPAAFIVAGALILADKVI
ncbi:hypothetical protein ACFVUS_12560 [Nocardia sp. NPDC058058]|uniref:hypothetical protein n=1 Tax=Nocardia sp. NPDC058058 TaxID=3346317 RepID=UPI0036D80E00